MFPQAMEAPICTVIIHLRKITKIPSEKPEINHIKLLLRRGINKIRVYNTCGLDIKVF